MEQSQIRPIVETYRRSNMFTHTFFKRGEYAIIYKVIVDTSFGSKLSNPVYYEVFRRKIGKGGLTKFPNGVTKMVEPFEQRPGDNSFGSWAWAIMSEEEALRRFDLLEANKGIMPKDATDDEVEEEDETENEE